MNLTAARLPASFKVALSAVLILPIALVRSLTRTARVVAGPIRPIKTLALIPRGSTPVPGAVPESLITNSGFSRWTSVPGIKGS